MMDGNQNYRPQDVKFSVALICVLSVYILVGPNLLTVLSSHGATTRQVAARAGGTAIQFVFLGVSTSLILLDILRSRRVGAFMPLSLALLLVWCGISVSWSEHADVATRRVILLSISIFYFMYAWSRIGSKLSLDLIYRIAIFILILDFVSVALGFGVHSVADLDGSLAGDWKGLHPHKNIAATFCGSLLIMSFWVFAQTRKYSALAVHALAFLFLIKTGSKTGVAAAPLACYLSWLLAILTRRMGRSSIFLFVGGLIVAFFLLNGTGLTLPSLRFDSFTGRGQIWIQLWPLLLEHKWMGLGFGSLWGLGNDSPVVHYSTGFVPLLSQGHNGYFDVVLTIGVIGLALTVYAFICQPLFRGAKLPVDEAALCWGLVLFYTINNFFESALLAPDFPSWLFAMAAVALTSYAPSRARILK